MCTEKITFDELPEAIAHLIKEVSDIKELIVARQEKLPENRRPIGIDEACRIIMKAKPTVYALVRKGKIPSYKHGKKLYFYEDELLSWISKGKRKTFDELKAEVETEITTNGRSKIIS